MTSADVARAAGVSRGAVSQILNGRGDRFAAATRDRVLQAASSLAYEPSAAARTLARGRSDLVVLLVPYTTFGNNLQDIVDQLSGELARYACTVIVHFSGADAAALDRLLAQLDPLALLPLGPLTEEERSVSVARAVPIAQAARGPVESPNRAIGALQAEHLMARGHTTFAFAQLEDVRHDVYSQERLAGFTDRLRQAGGPQPRVVSVALDPDAADAVLEQLGTPPVAVACYNDEVAVALTAAAGRRSWSLPGDLAVIGVDRIPLAQLLSPRITSVAIDPSQVARNFLEDMVATLGLGPSGPPTPIAAVVVQGETT